MGSLAAVASALLTLVQTSSTVTVRTQGYPDQAVVSSNSRLRLDCGTLRATKTVFRSGWHSPHTAVTLTDVETERVMWTRLLEDTGPLHAILHDSGWAVMLDATHELRLFEPTEGRGAASISVLDALDDSEKRFLGANPTWPERAWIDASYWRFVDHNDRLYLVVDLYWRSQLIIDVFDGALVESVDGLEAVTTSDRRAWTIGRLRSAINRPHLEVHWASVHAAVQFAGQDRLHDAVPLLRELERSEHSFSIWNGWIWNPPRNPMIDGGDIGALSGTPLTLRAAVHQALRQLGERPEPLACIHFDPRSSYEFTGPPEPGSAELLPRAERIEEFGVGARPVDVLRAIGPPDYVDPRQSTWEYDMDTETPYTLRLTWQAGSRLQNVTRIQPPVWKVGTGRLLLSPSPLQTRRVCER